MKNSKLKITPEIKAVIKEAPAFDMNEVQELEDFVPGKPVARGFAQFKEYINRKGRPKAENPKVGISIRIPMSYAAGLRATGRGWQSRAGEYIVKGIERGDFGNISAV